MSITKKILLSLINENLKEMAMDFDSPDRPHSDVTRALSRGETPLKKIPFPSTGVANKNFQEILASERYREVISNIRRYTGVQDTLGENPNQRLLGMMLDAHNRIIQIERGHERELENLAIDVVCDYMGIPKEEINWKVSLNPPNGIRTDDFLRDQPNEENPEEVNPEEENPQQPQNQENVENQQTEQQIFQSLQNLNLERAKQRLLNAIMQGASKKGHYLYHYVEEGLREITGSDQLINLYGVMMSINDANYWQFGDATISNLQSSVAGKVDVIMPKGNENDEDEYGDDDEEEGGGGGDDQFGDDDGDQMDSSKPTIVAQAVNFPALVHEVIKGAWKILTAHGQSEKNVYNQVKQYENTLEKEVWDLRLGPAIWNRIRESIPEEVLIENDKKLQNYLFMNIFKLPTKEFLVFMKEVISNSNNGKRLMSNMVESIKQMLRNEDYEQSMEQFQDDLEDISDETKDESIEDFLRRIGIDPPSEN